ncbi:MAG: hypothetical protein AB7Q69_16320, partial [Gemmatimonadales bacterium]
MRRMMWAAIPVLGAMAVACHAPGEPRANQVVGQIQTGRYQYTAYSAAGVPLLEGWLDIRQLREPVGPDDTTDAGGACCDWVIEGSWSITWVPGADTTEEVGPQVGSGTLRGAYTPEGLILDLTPLYADNNVGVFGRWSASGMDGRWDWDTFTGPRAGGWAEI